MKPDPDLLDQMLLIEDVDAERHDLRKLEDEYITACRLASGPNPQRAAHWTFKAKDMERELKRLCDRLL